MPDSANEIIRKKYNGKIRVGIALILCVIFTGILGFMLLEHYSFVEALYMTIITISTVGYGEVHPMDTIGRLFTSILIILNLGIFAYAISSITTFIAEGNLKLYFKYRQVQKQIEKLSGHIIVCGYGRNGKQACDMIEASHQPYVVIESDPARLETLRNKPNALFIEGNATEDEILMEAGISTAKALITTLAKDPDNVYVVLTAKEKNPSLRIISRASDESSEIKLKRAGADNVIMPERIGGTYMASLILRPDLVEFIATLTGRSTTNFAFEEITCEHLHLDDKAIQLKDLNVFKKFRTLVIGIVNSKGEYSYNPSPNSHINKDTKLIVLGSEEHIQQMKTSLKATK